MNRKTVLVLPLVLVLALSFLVSSPVDDPVESVPTVDRIEAPWRDPVSLSDRVRGPRPTAGPAWQRRYFERMHHPYGAVLAPDHLERIWGEVKNTPREDPAKAVNSWELVGPSGIVIDAEGALHSGRVLDIDAVTGSQTMVAAASGGLWGYELLFPVEKSKDITSQWIASFAINPQDENTILVGTGEFGIYGGTGIWKSTDGGDSWRSITVVPDTWEFCRIRYQSDGLTAHAATRAGYFRSTDDGETWTHIPLGSCNDLAIVESQAGTVTLYMPVWGEGLYSSADEGLTWSKMTNGVIPTANVSRGAVTVCASDPAVIYVAFAEELATGPNVMQGIYKTTNYGQSWTDVSPDFDYMNGQGWYNNVIAVCPTNPDLVLAGGVWMLRSEDGGATWVYDTVTIDNHLHGDFHALQWSPDGQYVWVGHDGGWSYSQQQGLPGTWISNGNGLPITQYVHMDVWGVDWETATIGGGAQDTGISISNDGGQTWWSTFGSDGGGFNIVPHNPHIMWMASGYFNTGVAFVPHTSSDGGHTWNPHELGLPDNDTFYPALRLDGDNDVYIHYYRNVYRYQSPGWLPAAFSPTLTDILEMTLTRIPGTTVIYCCTEPAPGAPSALSVLDRGPYLEERSFGLPYGTPVKKVVPHPTDSYRAYALMEGLGTPGQKVYITDDRGLHWYNLTGNLPNVPLSDMVVYPSIPPQLYLGTEFGFFRSLDEGASWEQWEYGLPRATIVSEMKALDLREYGGDFWVVASTYGRSIWRRAISGDDPSHVSTGAVPAAAIAIRSATPNPFNPATRVDFTTAHPGAVSVAVYDLGGRQVRQLLADDLPAGDHHVRWDGTDDRGRSLAAGVYVLKAAARGKIATTKVTLAK